MADSAAVPLDGVRVIDLMSNVSGPFGTMILAQQGADVIEVERPPHGDVIRGIDTAPGGVSAYFVNTDWGKRSTLRKPKIGFSLDRLIADADVLVENFRPTAMAGLGFPPTELC